MEIVEIKEALEQLVLKEPNFFNRIIKLSSDNVATKDDLKLLIEFMDKRFMDMQKYMDKRFEDMQKYMDKRFEDIQKYMDKRFEEINTRFDFITRLIWGFNIPLLLTMIGLLLSVLFKK